MIKEKTNPTQTIFFDLDGTLLDTARDFAFSINLLLAREKKPKLNFDLFRKEVYGESKRMISFAFGIEEIHPEFEPLRQTFLKTYHQHCTQHTIFFPGMELLLDSLDEKNIPWGIVTSKPAWLTEPVVNYFGLDKRAICIIMGDTLSKVKPDPAPLLYACECAATLPENSIYVGDLQTDIVAAKAAGMKSVAVTYGYHPPETDFSNWNADWIAQTPEDILIVLT
ncbi:MAG: hypothetical protein A3C44_04145 [Gammaproteobacteria bacterium RIFCSPHIGHO2_02_FULL_39_13]|nr:MAG: hypothetical protein A3C44_04145 [Gammaproteobacteria bacterium RIFCSPHIGHO2_02_FULL_39_13]OGT48267.1 MAG: hypothetical protein A3E53_07890 [Gammaproteobacteria bacterium RIFCSPHIGHO2_12_FULL_39_24]